jgi:hypothetical protein
VQSINESGTKRLFLKDFRRELCHPIPDYDENEIKKYSSPAQFLIGNFQFYYLIFL